MSRILSLYQRITNILSGSFVESIALLAARIALGGIFWRSYQTKIAEGAWFTPNDTLIYIFQDEYAGLPLSTDIAMPLTIYAEFLFPLLVFAGLFARFGAAALMVMALVIQVFIYPTSAHFYGWAMTVIGLCAFIISRGAGLFSLDAVLSPIAKAKAA